MSRLTRATCFPSALLVLSGCYRTTVTESVVERDRIELRRPAQPDAPLLSTTWHEEPGLLVGVVTPQTCEVERKWTTVQVRTTKQTPARALGAAGFVIAALLDVAAGAALATKPGNSCQGVSTEASCSPKEKDNTLSVVLLGTSVVFWIVGGVAVGSHPREHTEELSSETQQEAGEEPCLSVLDRTGSVLMARGAGAAWPVRWRTARELTITSPQIPQIPRGVELELVVFRSRPESADLWKRGTVVARFTIPVR